ncbi:MAG: type II toxin-antitoxin system VapC family toxin [Rhodopila sp.]
MILLDTNVLSDLIQMVPEASVERWLADKPASSVFTSAITEAEPRYGLALLPNGRKRSVLAAAMEAMLAEAFHGRILPFDSPAAAAFADIAAERRRNGRPVAQAYAQIAAVARLRGAALATRNVVDFAGCGIALINPRIAA